MLDRMAEQFDLAPSRLVADAGYGSAEMIGWLVDERGIEPHVNLMDKAERTDGTFSRSDFAFGIARVSSILPACASGRGRAPLFLLRNHRRARPDSALKMAYTYLP